MPCCLPAVGAPRLSSIAPMPDVARLAATRPAMAPVRPNGMAKPAETTSVTAALVSRSVAYPS